MYLFIMPNVKCITWNVRGIRAKLKHTAVLSYLKTQRAEIMVLVDTHLTGQLMLSLKKPWVGWLYQARTLLTPGGLLYWWPKQHNSIHYYLNPIPRAGICFCMPR